jgi:uncharacterized membrane protein YagU involved in acid resistance
MSRDPGLRSRLLIGAVAGFVGTMAMTAAMNRLHRRLPARERYPLPPREIIDAALPEEPSSDAGADVAATAHFLYGAAVGSVLGAANPRMGPLSGAAAGVAVWTISYLGWIPGVGLLKPATRHPPRRNLLMLAAHLVWGASTASGMRELMRARATILDEGDDRDVASPRRRGRKG